MDALPRSAKWRRYLRFWRADVAADVDDEVRFHLVSRTDDLMRNGLPQEEAIAQAQREFGDIAAARDALQIIDRRVLRRRSRRERWLLLGDELRYAMRRFLRQPGFVGITVLILAVGIGAWTLMFSVLNGLALRPLPVRQQDRVVLAWRTDTQRQVSELPFTEDVLTRFAQGTRTFAGVSAMLSGGATKMGVKGDVGIFYVKVVPVAGNFFDVLGAQAVLGRTLRPSDDAIGAPSVVVISYGLWQREFGGSHAVLGRSLRSNGRFRSIVGVMGEHFSIPLGSDVWMPLAGWAPVAGPRPTWPYLALVGRLAPDATVTRAKGEFGAYIQEVARTMPDDMPNAGIQMRTLTNYVSGDTGPVVAVLTMASALLLLLACLNVANLLIIRGTARQREMAVRTAIGARRGALARQLVAENVVIGAAAGVSGLALAAVGLRVFLAIAPPDIPRLSEMRIDWHVLAAGIAAAMASMLVFGLGSALWLSRGDLLALLRTGSREAGDSTGGRRLKRSLIAMQVGLAQLVLVGAGLLVNSFLRLEHVSIGFRAERLLTAQVAPAAPQFGGPADYSAFLEEALARLNVVPGVVSASVEIIPPLSGTAGWRSPYEAADQVTPLAGSNPMAAVDGVGVAFFRTLEVPVLRGREFTAADLRSPVPLAIVSRSLADQTWPGLDPIGRRIRMRRDSVPEADVWRTVVGVVGDVRYRNLEQSMPTIYLPYPQADDIATYLVIRTLATGTSLRAPLLAALRSINLNVWLLGLVPVPDVYAAPLARPRLDASLLLLFAIIALVLAAAGIYGLAAAYVRQRQRELGVRLALGATPGQLARRVSAEGVMLAGGGIVSGSLLALATGRVLRNLLFGVRPTDGLTFVVVSAFVLIVALIALYLPSRRAARLDPADALRVEAG